MPPELKTRRGIVLEIVEQGQGVEEVSLGCGSAQVICDDTQDRDGAQPVDVGPVK